MKTIKIIIINFLVLVFSSHTFSQIPSPYLYRWFPLNSGTTNDLNTIFKSGSSWVVGANGSIFRMDGDNLTPVNSGTTDDLYSMNAHENLWVVGENGTILKSTNGGLNWISVNSGTTNTLYSFAKTFINTFTVVGSNGLILRSTDKGVTWSPQTSGTTNDLYMINYSSLYNILIAGANGTLLKSTDFGSSWIPQNSGTTNNLNAICMMENVGYIVGSNGSILKTDNGGINWIQQISGTNENLNFAYFSGVNTGWVVGSGGTILRTSNGGINWIKQDSITNVTLNSMKMIGEVGWLVGDAGAFLKRRLDSAYLYYHEFSPNNIRSWIWHSGVFNQTHQYPIPSFEWPLGSGDDYVSTTGINVAGYYNNQIRMAAAFYEGECMPGYCENGVFQTDSRFRIYSVMKTDNQLNNPDWANWGLMVPFGAPFVDVNHNGTYEPQIDTPGVRNADQTLYICFTDANPMTHTGGNLFFGGRTQPLGAEFHLTAWGYNKPVINDIQFLKWEIINKSNTPWDSTFFGIVSDFAISFWWYENYIGCDSTRNLGYCYSANNQTPNNLISPAIGFDILKGPINKHVNPADSILMNSFVHFHCVAAGGPSCEHRPTNDPVGAYNYLQGLKKDRTPWYNPITGLRTKFCYPGDPETTTGWTEYNGSVLNCNGDSITSSNVISVNPPFCRKLVMCSGSKDLIVNPGDTQTIIIAQMIARGTSNLNSVTKLKELSDIAQNLYNSGFVIGVEPISSIIPNSFNLHQNYPNPFNPKTKIKMEIARLGIVELIVYDILGREVAKLVNEKLKPGTYEVEFDGSNYASGVYFYKLIIDDFSETKKMLLLK